ncbi:MAG: hypothetical protein M1609_11150, partial [Firmicutes bacterium]|nr:hypothetical protein [Bacillota bacterium]
NILNYIPFHPAHNFSCHNRHIPILPGRTLTLQILFPAFTACTLESICGCAAERPGGKAIYIVKDLQALL